MTPENLLDMIAEQVGILTQTDQTDEAVAVLTTCYERLVDLEMELESA